MSRTGEDENKAANTQLAQQQGESYRRSNAAMDKYNAMLADVTAKGNPFEDPTYLQTENRLATTATSAANKAGEEAIAGNVGRTGTNTASLQYTRAALNKNSARANADVLTQQKADDYGKAQAWKQWLLQAQTGTAPISDSLYGTSTSGRSAALKNLTDFGLASYGPVNALIGAAGTAASGYLSGLSGGGASNPKGCWIAAAIYGDQHRHTALARFWLNQIWAKQSTLGAMVMFGYQHLGQAVASVVRRSSLLQRALRPLFDRAVVNARKHALAR